MTEKVSRITEPDYQYEDFQIGNLKFRTGYSGDKYGAPILGNLILWMYNGYYYQIMGERLISRESGRALAEEIFINHKKRLTAAGYSVE